MPLLLVAPTLRLVLLLAWPSGVLLQLLAMPVWLTDWLGLAPGLPPAPQAQSAPAGAAKSAADSQSQATDNSAANLATGSAATNGAGKAQGTAGGAAQAANGAGAASTASAKVRGSWVGFDNRRVPNPVVAALLVCPHLPAPCSLPALAHLVLFARSPPAAG